MNFTLLILLGLAQNALNGISAGDMTTVADRRAQRLISDRIGDRRITKTEFKSLYGNQPPPPLPPPPPLVQDN